MISSARGAGLLSAGRRPAALALGFAGLLACSAPGPGSAPKDPEPPAHDSSPAAEALPPGPSLLPEGVEEAPAAAARDAAARAFLARQAPATALALARAYFPELRDAAAAAGAGEARALRALQDEDGLELSTRGVTVRVREISRPRVGLRHEGGATFAGARRFWAPAGRTWRAASGRWVADRVEEYVVARGEREAWRLAIDVPPAIRRVREAGDTLELLDGQGAPVMRLHAPVARDRAGREARGDLQLLAGAGPPEPAAPGLPATREVHGSRVDVALRIELAGLAAPVVVDPGWSTAAVLATPRRDFAGAQLADGTILVAGGLGAGNVALTSCERFDPDTGTWSAAPPLTNARSDPDSVLLPSGRLLVVGGYNPASGIVGTSELYDPATDRWSPAAAMANRRMDFGTTLLLDGRVLVAGGSRAGPMASVELYDPASNTWTPADDLGSARERFGIVRLPAGEVLVTGGVGAGGPLASSELFDPVAGTWTPVGDLRGPRQGLTLAVLGTGEALAIGGSDGVALVADVDRFDPVARTWRAAAPTSVARRAPAGAQLPSGRLLLAGGSDGTGVLASAELYDPAADAWSPAPALGQARESARAVVLPSGRVLVVGGYDNPAYLSAAELYDPQEGAWTAVAPLAAGRRAHTATPLADGRVLVAGGHDGAVPLATAWIYDLASGSWAQTGSLGDARAGHTATLVRDGRVLVAGGMGAGGELSSAELWDPRTGAWLSAGDLARARRAHTASLLPDGRVLVAGGAGGAGPIDTAEVWAPAGTFSAAGTLGTARSGHSATVLPGGRVLLAGGDGGTGKVAEAELFDLAAGTFTAAGTLGTARSGHVAARLVSGRVLVAGGSGAAGTLASAELWDPGAGSWSAVGSLAARRTGAAAALLPSGLVAVAGGEDAAPLSSLELYDPALDAFGTAPAPAAARSRATLALLPTGELLAVGGDGGVGVLASAERFEPTGRPASSLATITAPDAAGRAGQMTTVTGAGLLGSRLLDAPLAEPTPLLRLQDPEGGLAIVRGRNFSAGFVDFDVPAIGGGHYLLWVLSGGVATGHPTRVSGPPPARLVLGALPAAALAGTPLDLRVEAVDAAGVRVFDYEGTVAFSSTDPAATLPPTAGFAPEDGGVLDFPGAVVLRTAGTVDVEARDTGATLVGAATVQVDPGPAASLTVTGLPASLGAGIAADVTVEARDAAGNVATGYRGTVSFRSTDPAATLPPPATFGAADAGRRTFPAGVVLRTVGTQDVTAEDAAAGISGGQAGIRVDATSVARLDVRGVSSPLVAGSAAGITIEALDAAGNRATDYRGTIRFSSTDAAATLPPATTFGPADAGQRTLAASVVLRTAGLQAVSVTDDAIGLTGSQTGIQVNASTATALRLSGLPPAAQAGAPLAPVVEAVDAFGNVAPAYRGEVQLASSDPRATLPAPHRFTAADAGAHAFPGLVLAAAGLQSVTASDAAGGVTAARADVDVQPGAATRLALSTDSSQIVAGAAADLSIEAQDAFGNRDPAYAGTVTFTASDGRATVPPPVTLAASDGGRRTLAGALVLRIAGAQVVTGTDDAGLSGQLAVDVSAAGADHVVPVPAAASAVAGGDVDVVLQVVDSFGNAAPGTASVCLVAAGQGGGSPELAPGSLAGGTQPNAGTVCGGTAPGGTATVVLRDTRVETVGLVATSQGLPGSGAADGSATVSFAAGPPDHLRITGDGRAVACEPETVGLQVVDGFGNAVTDPALGEAEVSVSVGAAAGAPAILSTTLGGVGPEELPAASVTGTTAPDGSASVELFVAAGGTVSVAWSSTDLPGDPSATGPVAIVFEPPPAGTGCTSTRRPQIVESANPRAALGLPWVYDADGRVEAAGDAPMRFAKVAGPASLFVNAVTGAVTWLPAAAGDEVVTLSATNPAGTDTYTFAVTVTDAPPAPPAASIALSETRGNAPLLVTADGSASTAAPGSTLVSWRWDFGDGGSLGFGPSAEHTYLAPGVYQVRLTVADDLGATATASAPVTVTRAGDTPPTVRVVASATAGEGSLSVDLSCDCAAGSSPIAAYRWDFGDGTVSDLPAATHVFASGGWQVRLTVTGEDGLASADAVSIAVAQGDNLPPQVVAQAIPLAGPAPLEVRFLAAHGDLDGEVVAVRWTFEDGQTSSEDEPVVRYEAPGLHLASVNVTDDGGLGAIASVEVNVTSADGGSAPQIVSVPAVTASAGGAYRYDQDGLPSARGDRPLSWSLGKTVAGRVVGMPEGMTIEPATGEISWTPAGDQLGPVHVTLVARNGSGVAVQEWEVEVAPGTGPGGGGGGGGGSGGSPAGEAEEGGGCGCGSSGGGSAAAAMVLAALWLRVGRRG